MSNKPVLLVLTALFYLMQIANAQYTFEKQGHRGCRGLLPENSIPAMEKAVDIGATLEMDISFSKEKIAIVSHDQYISSVIALKPNGDTISKAEEKNLALYQMPYEQIKQYLFGQKPYPLFPDQKPIKTYIPVLADLIDSVENHAKRFHTAPPRYNIETKTTVAGDNILHPGPEEFVQLLMKVIIDKGIQSRSTIQSFDPRTLEIVHKKYPGMPTALLVSAGSLANNLKTLTFKPTYYSPYYKIFDQPEVDQCHALGIKMLPWTVNSEADIAKLKSWKVDGIISDYPDRL